MPKLRSSVLGILTVLWLAPSVHGYSSSLHPVQGRVSSQYPPDTVPAPDPVARLQEELDEGTVQLQYDTLFGYLPGLLHALNIPVSSQTHALPAPMLTLVYDRIASVLDQSDRTGDFDHLDSADRTAIREILEVTLPSWTGRESRQ